MTLMSVGDLAKVFTLRRHSTELKQALNQLSSEAATGQTSDLSRTVHGDFSAIAGLHKSLTLLNAYRLATNEAATFTDAAQATLETVEKIISDGGSGLVQSSMSTNSALIINAGLDIKQRFNSAVAAFNTRVGEQTLFAGAATDSPALAPAEDILAALRAATSGTTTATSLAAAVSVWFADPLGYSALAYKGSATPLAPFQIGEGEQTQFATTADHQAVKNALESLALGALVGEGALQGTPVEQSKLARLAGDKMLVNAGGLTYVRAAIGTSQANIDAVATRNSAESASLQLAISAIVAVDPYEAASALLETQTQLETLYAITARLSHLHLTDYLR